MNTRPADKHEMNFVEGVYRLLGNDWQVVIFIRRPIERPLVNQARWQSGATGINVLFPQNETLNKGVVLRMLSAYLRVTEWREVRGPSSMSLR